MTTVDNTSEDRKSGTPGSMIIYLKASATKRTEHMGCVAWKLPLKESIIEMTEICVIPSPVASH